VSGNELSPSGLLIPFRSRRNAVTMEDASDGLIGNAVA
jgi:hypothetical protein